jgi:hypothetical protein
MHRIARVKVGELDRMGAIGVFMSADRESGQDAVTPEKEDCSCAQFAYRCLVGIGRSR